MGLIRAISVNTGEVSVLDAAFVNAPDSGWMPAPPPPLGFSLGSAILGGLTGFLAGGPVGALAGATVGGFAESGAPIPAPIPGGLAPSTFACPPGTFPGPLGTCIDIIPGAGTSGRGLVFAPDAPVAVSPGMFGVLSTAPGSVSRRTLICPPGLVLGKDERCYAKGTITPKQRKWRPDTKCPVTAFDAKMMRKFGPGGTKQDQIKKLAGDAGFITKRKA